MGLSFSTLPREDRLDQAQVGADGEGRKQASSVLEAHLFSFSLPSFFAPF